MCSVTSLTLDATSNTNVHRYNKKASVPWRHKSPERLALKSSDHFPPPRNVLRSPVGLRSHQKPSLMMGGGFFTRGQISHRKTLSRNYPKIIIIERSRPGILMLMCRNGSVTPSWRDATCINHQFIVGNQFVRQHFLPRYGSSSHALPT